MTERYGVRLGRKVKAMREARNWGQKDLAERLQRAMDNDKVSGSYVRQLEKGHIPSPGIETVVALATVFGFGVDDLLDFRAPPMPEPIDRLRRDGVPDWAIELLHTVYVEGTPEEFSATLEDLRAVWESRRKRRPQQQPRPGAEHGAGEADAGLRLIAEEKDKYTA